ncbi:CHRD domain-containing protein [Paraglaciecola sp.]|uniref:CHRD domain-containing protein n=1 Tax=Paraglaciecola sp. TaxID=1920173 RepID=UPI0030F38B52
MKKHYKILTTLTLFASLLLGTSNSASASLIKFSASLDGIQTNAGVGTGSLATGWGTMLFDDVTNDFWWEISWSGLQAAATAAHFHGPALPNQNAGVQVAINVGSNPSSGNTVLTAQQASDLMNSLWYVNIHTSIFPGGEIHGQVLQNVAAPSATIVLDLSLLVILRRRTFKN